MNGLLGSQPGDAYLTGPEVVARLERLAAAAPVREGVGVARLARAGDGYAVSTDDGELRARTVVVATGDQNRPRLPALAGAFPERVAQVHAAGYRDTGRLPWRHRGRDTVEWLAEAGFVDQRPRDLPDPSVMGDAQPIVAPGGRSLSLPALARAGVTLAGRPVAVDGERVAFNDSLAANVAAGDALAARLRGLVDDSIRRRGLDAPPAEPDDHDRPADLDPPASLDLRAERVAAVVWCTGFGGDFSFLDPSLVGAEGTPVREDAAGPVPGLWYLGLRWLRRRSSGSCSASPGTPPWSPTPSGPTWPGDAYRNAARPSAW